MDDHKYHRRSTFWITVTVALVVSAMDVIAQPAEVVTELSSPGSQPNEEFTLTLAIEEPADLYYYGMEVDFDPEQFEFLSLQNTGLTEGGINIDGEISANRIGVSVSRTDGEAISGNGAFMELAFRVRPTAAAGPFELTFLNTEMYNSEGQLLESDPPEPALVDVLEGVGVMHLTIPETNQVTEGEPFIASGQAYASGITLDEEHAGRLTTWIGVHTSNSNPESWEEDSWLEMELAGVSDQFYTYMREIALFRDVGIYYVAFRSQLDDGALHYGGLHGFWDAAESPSASLEIVQAPAFRYVLAHWDFSGGQLMPSQSVPDNDLAEIEVIGAQITSISNVLNTNNWHDNEETQEKYFHVAISTVQFENLQLSSSHDGSNTGPRYFQVQLSEDGDNWTDLPGGEIDLGEGAVHLQHVPVPAAFNDSEIVHIRWLRGDDEQIGNSGTEISSTGTHRISNITISGNNTDPQRVDVLPGDTNHDGIVNSQDVLVLGQYWLSRGPEPVYDFITFEPREVEQWIPAGATFADANGDGIVNQQDLLPIGLNFGKSVQDAPARIARPQPLAAINLSPLKAGEEAEILLQSREAEPLKGLAYRLTLDGLSPRDWSLVKGDVPEWAGPWAQENRLIDFQYQQQNALEEAYVYRGRNAGLEVQDLIVLRIRAENDWPGMALATLEWLSVSRPDGAIEQLSAVDMVSADMAESGGPEIPSVTRLHQNYPNPFNPATVIRYELSGESQVRLDVFNLIGQHVATLVETHQQPGAYTFDFDAGDLASGLYIYRLQTAEQVLTKRMMLVK